MQTPLAQVSGVFFRNERLVSVHRLAKLIL
jgi:hypothetical protein